MSSIQIRQWSHRGTMLVNTSALEPEDPDHPYNQALSQGVRPEDYGLTNPLFEKYANMSRADLIRLVRELERENEALQRHLA